MRYYRCNGRKTKSGCTLSPIRKELIEQLVIDAVVEAFNKTDLDYLADKILEQNKKTLEDTSVLNLLTAEYNETEKAINHLLSAMEQGIYTQSTKERLERLEEKKAELEMKITIEKTREKTALTKAQIIEHLRSTMKLHPKSLLDIILKKVVLYNDKIEIYCNYTKNDPDGTDSHRDFVFYEKEIVLEIDRHTFGGEVEKTAYIITLFI